MLPLVAGRPTGVVPRHGRGRSPPTGGIERSRDGHGIWAGTSRAAGRLVVEQCATRVGRPVAEGAAAVGPPELVRMLDALAQEAGVWRHRVLEARPASRARRIGQERVEELAGFVDEVTKHAAPTRRRRQRSHLDRWVDDQAVAAPGIGCSSATAPLSASDPADDGRDRGVGGARSRPTEGDLRCRHEHPSQLLSKVAARTLAGVHTRPGRMTRQHKGPFIVVHACHGEGRPASANEKGPPSACQGCGIGAGADRQLADAWLSSRAGARELAADARWIRAQTVRHAGAASRVGLRATHPCVRPRHDVR